MSLDTNIKPATNPNRKKGLYRFLYSNRFLFASLAIGVVAVSFTIYLIVLERRFTIDEVLIKPLTQNEKKLLKKFNNGYHLRVAKQKGIKETVCSVQEIEENPERKAELSSLKKLRSNHYFSLQRLIHSLPYAQPDVHDFLDELGSRFSETLRKKNIAKYKFYVTSVLRTEKSQKKLTKVNINATRNESAHLYGRTIDIAKTQFWDVREEKIIYSPNLGTLLTRELLAMQDEGLCYVLFETKNHCLHITVR